MKVGCLLVAVLSLSGWPFTRRNAEAAMKPESPAFLEWRNGEALPGELVSATATELTWESEVFEEPLVLKWNALRRIRRESETSVSPGPWRVSLRDGSHLYGELVAVSPESITIRSERHGEAVLRSSEVLSVRRLRSSRLILAGPTGDAGWRPVGGPTGEVPASLKPVAPIRTGAGGALVLPLWNRGATLDLLLPERVDVEFRVRSSKRPDFQLALGADGRPQLRVETWDDEIVLVAGDGFQRVGRLAADDRTLALRLCWDRIAHRCSVFTPLGEQVADWTMPAGALDESVPLLVQNKGRDLTLELLSVRTWDGKAPARLTGTGTRVELSDGRILEGRLVGGEPGTVTFVPNGAAPVAPPLRDLEAIVFSNDAPQTGEPGVTLTYADGALVHGRLESIADGRAIVITPSSEHPLAATLAGLRHLTWRGSQKAEAPAESPLAEQDTLTLPGTKLRGKLAAVGEAQPRWLPVGAAHPVPLKAASQLEIRRAIVPEPPPPDAPALIYLATGDVLAGDLRGLNRESIEIASDFTEMRRLPAEVLDAIQFGATSVRSMKGFGDAGWQIVRGNAVRKTDETVELPPGSALGHPAIMQSGEIAFSFSVENNFGGVRLRLFSGLDDRARAPTLLLLRIADRLMYSLGESEAEQEQFQQQFPVPASGTLAVRLAIDEQQVQLFVNGSPVTTFTIPANQRQGSGIVVQPGQMPGNEPALVTLSDLMTKAGTGRTWLPNVAQDARMHALTVPRFRQDDPPRHVLLAANGDVLRGEIEAVTASHLGFRSGLENLRVPRDRVRAAVWLKPADPAAPPSPTPDLTTKTLGTRLTRRVRYSSAGLSTLIGVLQREAPGLKVHLPPQFDSSHRTTMQFGGQTVAEALDEICRVFRLRYRVDRDTVVLEPDTLPGMETPSRVYWLPPDALPADGSAQRVLTGHGVPFNANASVLWQPKTGALTVTDSRATHEKLAAVLGTLTSGAMTFPTHWLLLTHGARLGLAVEKFEPGAVLGRHPILGACRVPLAQVHTVLTNPPAPTATMKALADWRLIAAPEPVLPETGGQSSPILGKAANIFTLPLLGGGGFDLAAAKGRVVVLDFWATWCGPCVKALPPLIEAMAAFPPDRVMLVGVNQGEPPAQVTRFLETRGWKLTVALDAGQKVGREYGVEGIPHTVIVGPDGQVAWVKTGYSASGAAEAAEVVKKLLSDAPAAAK